MNPLMEKSIQTLELPRVLQLLSECATTAEGRERAMLLRPMTDLGDIARAQSETTAAVNMLLVRGSISFSGVRAVAASVQRADMGGCLSTRELLDIAVVLRATRTAKDYGASEEKTPISHLFAALTPNKAVEEEISTSILGEDEIADAASTQLAAIRRHIRASEGKVRDILQKLISSSQAKYLQEAIVTLRSDRYVVPVKAEHKNAIAGLVHDVSSSGSTFFIEPMAVVNANNELRELLAAEKKEIERILAQLSARCAACGEEIMENYRLLVWLDEIFAKGQLSLKLSCSEAKLSEQFTRLNGARHPLLPVKKAVANDLQLGEGFDTLVITGPNTGGKTVTLKTIGLITLMAQCGLHIPAKSDSTVRVFEHILADIGDEQSIDQSLSTFSSHMSNIVSILACADEKTLILFDELGAGTDPVEGAALATAILESARAVGAMICATTHYAELKVYAMSTQGVENASCEFDVETLAPTYRLIIGIPGKSNAFAISRRLGLSEEIIQQAAQKLNAENVRFEDVLTRLEQQRQQMEHDRREAARLKLEIEQSAQKAREYRQQLEREREKVVDKANKEAREIIKQARDASDLAIDELKQLKRQQERLDWQQVNDVRADARRLLNDAERGIGGRVQEMELPPPTRAAVAGDVVQLVSMGTRANVHAVNKDGTLQLQAGILKITAKQDEVRVLEGEQKNKAKQSKPKAQPTLNLTPASREIDLRGMMTDEAIAVLENFLDAAMLGKLETVTIIHGKGTGAVRSAVRTYLKRSRYVKSFRAGLYGEGEDGVTVAEIR